MERKQFKKATEGNPTGPRDEGPTEEGNLRQKDVRIHLFSNKLIMNLQKEKLIENKRQERQRQKK